MWDTSEILALTDRAFLGKTGGICFAASVPFQK